MSLPTEKKCFIEVILPVPLENTYTYSVPYSLQKDISPGCLVLVGFGKNKHYSALVYYIHQITIESKFEIKDILAVESGHPILRRPQMRFWEWISEYYLCRLGEVYKAVIPSGFRTESASVYSPKTENHIRLASVYTANGDSLHQAFDLVKKAIKQEKLLLAFLEYAKPYSAKESRDISRKELLERSRSNESALSGLLNKGILEIYEKEISRLDYSDYIISDPNRLNPVQQQAFYEINHCFREKDVCLLHGVTSAGKTEIYIHLINEALRLNRQALFLLPEIALTTQITDRLKKVFGNKLGIYHSKINDKERVEIWNNMLQDDGYRIILGVRSSIFLPFRDLGLIIVDEEHEPSYKQQDPAPRYHARNAAIVLATMHGAKVILGSATPSIESFHNAQTGKYGYVQLDKRFEAVELPLIIPVNVKELRRKKKMKTLFSPLLIEKMGKVLDEGEQVILFQNRRGFAPAVQCQACDWTPQCRYCDVSLTYHKKTNRLACHYCGNVYSVPTVCPDCKHTELKLKGFGTEKVEEEIITLFPEISVARLDTDTARNKHGYEEIIRDFEQGKTRILVGTQMVSKGLDFGNVSLVGILNADSMMNFPDFRAHERAYQLMAQVAGRAGRRKKRGEVILQTSHPEHPLIQQVLNNDYEGMYRMQSEERMLFRYPPFYRILEITMKHRQEEVVASFAKEYAALLRASLGDRLLGPDKPVIGRIQNHYLQRILLKIEVSASLQKLRAILEETQEQLFSNQAFKYVVIQFDVDPVG